MPREILDLSSSSSLHDICYISFDARQIEYIVKDPTFWIKN